MTTDSPSLRHRNPNTSTSPSTPTPPSRFQHDLRGSKHLRTDGSKNDNAVVDLKSKDYVKLGVLDVIRVLGGILLLSSALSWFVTGDSVLWGWRPWWSRGDALGAWLNGPVILTDAELKQYDGSDPNTPIYVALNGTIYDVTGGRRIYGPGGSYNIFAGRDATRAFITGCFAEDLTPDTRGVEEMFMPIYPDEELSSDETSRQQDSASKASKTQVKLRRERDRRNANKQIRETIDHWAALFRGERGDKPYFEVGKVKREEGWLDALPKRALCESAKKSRPKVKDENSS